MLKILKTDAFQYVVSAMDKGDFKTANEIFDIIIRTIMEEKVNRKFSEEIVIKNKKEERLFEKYNNS